MLPPFAPPRPPRFWFPFFLCSQTTSGQLCCFFVQCSFVDTHHCCCYQRQHLSSRLFFFFFACTPPQDTLGEGGWGAAGRSPTPHQGRWGPAPWMLQQSEEGAHFDGKGCRATDSPCSVGEGWPVFVPAWGLPLVSYLQILELKNSLFWRKSAKEKRRKIKGGKDGTRTLEAREEQKVSKRGSLET